MHCTVTIHKVRQSLVFAFFGLSKLVRVVLACIIHVVLVKLVLKMVLCNPKQMAAKQQSKLREQWQHSIVNSIVSLHGPRLIEYRNSITYGENGMGHSMKRKDTNNLKSQTARAKNPRYFASTKLKNEVSSI